jgi:hypothetical protein
MCIEDVQAWILSQSGAFGKWWSANAASLTPVVIGLSVFVAIIALRTQRRLTRQRATYDLFLKTELDSHALALWTAYTSAVEVYQSSSAPDSFVTEHPMKFKDICVYLSIYELVACGIKSKLLDEKLCFAFWQRIMRRDYRDTHKLLEYMRTQPDLKDRFPAYPLLIKRWNSRRS